MSFVYLIEVKGFDSSGKSVYRCDPTESEVWTKAKNATSCGNAFVTNILLAWAGTRTTRGKRPPVTEIMHFNIYVSLRSLNIAVRKVILYNLERHSLNHS